MILVVDSKDGMTCLLLLAAYREGVKAGSKQKAQSVERLSELSDGYLVSSLNGR